jgi:hypothetical protein
MRRPVKLALTSAILVFSCGAKRQAEVLKVDVPEGFVGTLNIAACNSKAPDEVVADAKGEGTTSICSASKQLRMTVRRGAETLEIPAQDVKVVRTGDDIVILIQAQVPAIPPRGDAAAPPPSK